MNTDNGDDNIVNEDENVPPTEPMVKVDQLEKFGDYEIQKLLGEGTFAQVHLAKDKMDRLVALKILKKQYAHDDKFVDNFRQEANMAAGLIHENIIRIYDQDESEGQFYISMEYAPVGTLLDYIDEQERISLAEIKSFIQQIANALDMAHQDNIVHRDIKPSNILLGYNNKIKLADFGIARAVIQEQETRRLSTTIQGTADYMAPEQADPSAKIDGRTDVYAFAIVVYEILSSGFLPFGDGVHANFVDIINQKRTEKPKPIDKVPTHVMHVIEKTLQPNPRMRPRTAGDFATELIKSIRIWEQSTAIRQDKRDLSGMAVLAMEQEEWQDAKEYWEESLKMGDSLVARSNLTIVNRELDLQDAWAKVSEGFDKAEWGNVLAALESIQKLDPQNGKALSRREEAELQLKMQSLYEEGDEAFAIEDYAVAVNKFEAIYEQIPDYRDVAERLEEVQKNRVKEDLNRLRENALLALIESDVELARSTEQEILKRAPRGEYGVESFLERFGELLDKLEQERVTTKTTLINYKDKVTTLEGMLKDQVNKNEHLEVELRQIRQQLEQEQQDNVQLRKELENRLLAYFTDLQEMVKHLDSRLLKTATIRDYTNQLRERIREIAMRGQELESGSEKNITEA